MDGFKKIVLLLTLFAFSAGAAYGQFPATGNKSRLGYQTTGDGLIYRGTIADTVTVKPAALANAYFLLDTVNAVLYRYIKTKQGWQRVDGGAAQQLGVGADGGNGATLYLSDTDEGGTSATVVVDNATAARLPWDGNAVIGILTVTTITHAVTITGTGLVSVTEVAAAQDGQIFLDVTIPAGHVDYAMLSQAVKDSIALGGTGETDLSFAGTVSPVTLRSSTGDSVAFVAGDYITLAATDSTMTINSVTNLSVTQGASGETSVVVDNLTDVRLPWDGNAVVGVVESGSQTTIFLTVNGQQVQFDPIPNGDKGDIIVSDAGAVMMIDTAVVDWDNLTQALKDSILLAAGGFELPTDSITFNNNETDPDSLELQYNYDKGSLVYGANHGVEIPILPGHWYVKNDTSVTITKGTVVRATGTVVRATGTVGASGRILVKHMIANGTIDAMYLMGIAAHDIAPGEDGYIMWQGKIRKLNTDNYNAGAVLYADALYPGELTETEPTGSNLKLPIAFVVNKSATQGVLAVRVTTGAYLRDLHDASTQGAKAGSVPYMASSSLLTLDTTFRVDVANGNFSWGDKSILTGSDNIILGNYANIKTNTGVSNIILGRDAGGQNMQFGSLNIIIGQGSAFALTNGDQNIVLGSFSATDITTGSNNIIIGHSTRLLNPNNNNQLNIGNTIFATGMDSTNLAIPRNGKVGILKNNPAASLHVGGKVRIDTLSSTPGALIALGTDSTIARLDPATYPTVTELSYVKGVTSSVQTQLNTKLNATDTASLSNRINLKLNISDTSAMLSTYINTVDTSAMLSPYLKKQDTISLSNRINLRLNISDTTAMLSTYINAVDTSAMLLPYLKKQDTISLSNRINTKLNATDTASLSNRINLKLNISDTSAMLSTYINTVDTSAMLLPYLKKQDTISLSNRINAKLDTTDNSVKTKHITNGAVTSAKLADGAAGLAKLGGVKYITVDSVSRDISAELDTFSQIIVYLFIDSLSTGYDTITLPTPSATHAGKIVELYSDDLQNGGPPSMLVKSSTNGIRLKDGFNKPQDFTITDIYVGDTQLLYVKFVCMPHPRTGNYQWVGISHFGVY